MPLKKIQHTARYNNFIADLDSITEDAIVDMHGFVRLLAMESDYKEWVAEQMEKDSNQPPIYLSEEMVNHAQDEQVCLLREVRDEFIDLMGFLSIYLIDTDDLKADYN